MVDEQKEIKYDLYNQDLELEKTETVLIPKGLRFDEMYYNDDFVYNAYTNKNNEMVIIGVNMNDVSISKTTCTLPKKTFVSEMKVLGDYVFLLASMKQSDIIYKVELSTGKATAIPVAIGSYSPKKLQVSNYQILEISKEILFFIYAYSPESERELYMTRISEDGTINEPIKMDGTNNENLGSLSFYRVSESKLIFTGNNGVGLFFGELEDNQISYIKFYNFLDLKDFLSYLSEKKQEKIEQKKEKKEAQGKELLINYLIADHEIIVLKDGYLFLGEAFYPTYRTETYTTAGPNGTTVTRTRNVFDGYQYTHAVVAKFSKEGEMVWDICFEMWPSYKPFTVKRFIAISDQTASSISMVFTSGNSIVSKSVDFDGNIINDRKWDMMETGQEGDKAKWTSSSIVYWYDNYFLARGSQSIKNTEDKSKRKVYFVNKIGF